MGVRPTRVALLLAETVLAVGCGATHKSLSPGPSDSFWVLTRRSGTTVVVTEDRVVVPAPR